MLVGPLDLMSWWVWKNSAHNGQFWMHGHLMSCIQGPCLYRDQISQQILFCKRWIILYCILNSLALDPQEPLLLSPMELLIYPTWHLFPPQASLISLGLLSHVAQGQECLYCILELLQIMFLFWSPLKAGYHQSNSIWITAVFPGLEYAASRTPKIL